MIKNPCPVCHARPGEPCADTVRRERANYHPGREDGAPPVAAEGSAAWLAHMAHGTRMLLAHARADVARLEKQLAGYEAGLRAAEGRRPGDGSDQPALFAAEVSGRLF